MKAELANAACALVALILIIFVAGTLAGCEVIKAGYDACREGDCR
jgi:hypothetical protein